MKPSQLDLIAAHMVASYNDTAIYSRAFKDDHKAPPSLMAKVHHMRSIAQARLTRDPEFDLASAYAEYGRVEFIHVPSKASYLLRSAGAVAVEKAKRPEQLALFAFARFIKPSNVSLLVYEFTREGLRLSLASAVQRPGGKRLFARGEPILLGYWPYLPDDDTTDPPFNQGIGDPFEDVGDLNEGDEEPGGAG
jgi:hypothetical protein